jgi:hypothetical protein
MQNNPIDVPRRSTTVFAGEGLLRWIRSRAVVAVAAASVAACAHRPPEQNVDTPPVNLSGYSPAFREGFGDGCETARGRSKKTDSRYAEDTQYRRGWDDGRAICARR